MTRRLIIESTSFLLIVLFVYAAVTKLSSFEQFSVQIGQSPMLTPMRQLIAVVIPGVELVVSLLLAINATRIVGLYTSFALMALFTAYIVAVTQFSEHIPCSCGGVLETMSWTEHLVFNIGFLMLTGVAIILHEQAKITAPTGN